MPASLPTVLVVDDNPVNQLITRLMVDSLGYTSVTASSGREALEILDDRLVDAVLMDLSMPELDGFETTALIREMDYGKGKRIPVIAVTAMPEPDAEDLCVSAGLDDFVAKPFTIETLGLALKGALQSPQEKRFPRSSDSLTGAAESFNVDDQTITRELAPLNANGNPVNMSELFRLYGAKEVEDVLRIFFKYTGRQLEALDGAIIRRDSRRARVLAQEVRAASSGVTAEYLSHLSRRLENACRNDRWEEVSRFFREVSAEFRRVEGFAVPHR